MEQLEENLPEQVHNTADYREDYSDTEMEMEMEEPSGWLFSHDVIEAVGYLGGSFLFLSIFEKNEK